MNGKEILKKAKHMPKHFGIIYLICIIIIIGSIFIGGYKLENEKPNATDFTQNGAIGLEPEKYVYMQVEGLTDVIATYGSNDNTYSDENDKYYIAISDGYWYIVNLDSIGLEELKEIQEYTFGNIENKPAPVTIYGITEEIPTELKEIVISVYNEGIPEEEQISMDEFELYFGSVLLNARRTPSDLTIETVAIGIAVIVIFVTIIVHIANKITRIRIMKYLKKNDYEDDLITQLDDNVEEKFYNDKVIITKDYFVDTTNGSFCAVKFSDIKWIHTHRVKYYGVITVSSDIILHLKDCKTNFQCLNIKGNITPEFESVFDKICSKMPSDSLKGYTPENINEFKQYKKDLKNNAI